MRLKHQLALATEFSAIEFWAPDPRSQGRLAAQLTSVEIAIADYRAAIAAEKNEAPCS